MENIFDLQNTRDLPESLQKLYKPRPRKLFEEKMVDLLNMAKRPLNYHEIQVGWFRLYGIEKPIVYFRSRLHSLAGNKKPVVRNVNSSWEVMHPPLEKEMD